MFTLTPDEATMPEDENECRLFVDAILNGAPLRTPASEGVALMRVIDALYASAASGEAVQPGGKEHG